MSQNDRSSPWIEPRGVGAKFLRPGQRHTCKCLVDLIGVDVVEGQAPAVQRRLRRWNGRGQHVERIIPGDGERVEPGAGPQAARERHLLAHDQRRRRPVGQRRRVSGRDPPVQGGEARGRFDRGERRLEPAQRFGGGARPNGLIDGVRTGAPVRVDHRHRDDLIREASVGDRGSGPLV